MARKYKVTTQDVDREIKRMQRANTFNNKTFIDDLAYEFECSTRTIYNRLKDLGIGGQKVRSQPYDIDPAKAYELYKMYEFDPVQYTVELPKEASKSGDNRPIVLCLGDFQAGALRTSEGYNPTPIAQLKDYIAGLKESLHKRFYNMATLTDFTETDFYIFGLGDLVDGEAIYLNQEVIPVWQQLKETTQIVYDLIQFIHAFGWKSIKLYNVAGNHGRQPSRFVDEGTNWDTQVAYVLKSWYKIHHEHGAFENVSIKYTINRFQEVQIPKPNAKVEFDEFDPYWTYMLHHGDFVRGGLDVKKIEHAINMWKLDHFSEANAWVIGHWHKVSFGKTFNVQYLINGSLYDSPYEKEKLKVKGTIAMTMFRVGDTVPIEDLYWLDLEAHKWDKSRFSSIRFPNP